MLHERECGCYMSASVDIAQGQMLVIDMWRSMARGLVGHTQRRTRSPCGARLIGSDNRRVERHVVVPHQNDEHNLRHIIWPA